MALPTDALLWQVIGKQGACSYQRPTQVKTILCAHPLNARGQCRARYCPLASGRYACVREHEGQLFLWVKTPERRAYPNRQWEQTLLPSDPGEARALVQRLLVYWPQHLIDLNLERIARYHAMFARIREIYRARLREPQPELAQKIRRREQKREAKALRAAHLEQRIQAELLHRLRIGVYDAVLDSVLQSPDDTALVEAATDPTEGTSVMAGDTLDTQVLEAAYDDLQWLGPQADEPDPADAEAEGLEDTFVPEAASQDLLTHLDLDFDDLAMLPLPEGRYELEQLPAHEPSRKLARQ